MQVTVQSIGEPVITVSGGTEYSVGVSVLGIQGPAGAGALVGDGLQVVGSEIRYNISSLTRG